MDINDTICQNQSLQSSYINKSDSRLFTKLNKDSENLEFYYKKSLKRFKACCSSLGYLFEPLSDKVVVKVRTIEFVNFLKRLFLFDFKKLVTKNLTHLQF